MSRSSIAQKASIIEPQNLLAYRLLSLSQLLNRGIEVVLDTHLGLSVRQWRVLLYLANAGPSSVQHIADFCRYDKSQVSRAVSELLDKKLVRSASSPSDGRRIVVALTAAGRKVYEQGLPLSLARQDRLASCLTGKELAAFQKTLETLTRQAEILLGEAHAEKERAAR